MNNQIKMLAMVCVTAIIMFAPRVEAKPNWSIPLEGGHSYKVTVQYGGLAYDGSTDPYHTDLNNGHYAIDFDNPSDMAEPNVVAAADGVVNQIFSDPAKGYGYGVRINHGGGYESLYGHFRDLPLVKVGDNVAKGQKLGIMGRTGKSTGTHLHFAVIFNGLCKSTTPESKPEPMSGYTNFTVDNSYTSDNYGSITSFTFDNGNNQGMMPNASMVTYPLGGSYGEWRTHVIGSDPGVDSPSYSPGIIGSDTVIEFSAKVISGGNPVSEGRLYIKDEYGSWNNSVTIHLINSEVGYNNGQFAVNNYNVYRANLSELGRPSAQMRQFSIQLTNGGHGTGENWTFDWIKILTTATTWDFATNQMGWTPRNAASIGFPDGVNWLLNPNEVDPGIVSLFLKGVNASSYPYLNIRMAAKNAPAESRVGGVYFATSSGAFSEGNSVKFTENVNCDGDQHWYTMKMNANPNWNGNILQLRIDPMAKAYTDLDDRIWIDRIELSTSPRSGVINYTNGYTLLLGNESEEELPPLIPLCTLNRVTTAKGQTGDPDYLPIYETVDFLNSDGRMYAWVELINVYGVHTFNWKWYYPDGQFGGETTDESPDPASQGYAYYGWVRKYCWVDISSSNVYGQWRVDTYVDGIKIDTRYMNLNVVLNQPVNLVANNVAATSVDLSWSTVANAASYNIYRSGQLVGVTTQPSYADTGLSAVTSYTYQVRAGRGNTLSSFSNAISITTLYATPDAATNLAASNVTSDSATLAWTAGANNSTFRVYRNNQLIATTSQPTHFDSGLSPNTTYIYQIKAVNGNIEAIPSNSLSVTTSYAAPGTVSSLTVGVITANSIELTWSPGANASKYLVYRNGLMIGEAPQTNFVDIGLTAQTTYSYYVVSLNGTLTSNQSPSILATTLTSSSVIAPVILRAYPVVR